MSLINEYGNPGHSGQIRCCVIATTRLSGNIRSNQLGEVPCCCRIRQAVQRNVKHATAVKESMAVNDVTVRVLDIVRRKQYIHRGLGQSLEHRHQAGSDFVIVRLIAGDVFKTFQNRIHAMHVFGRIVFKVVAVEIFFQLFNFVCKSKIWRYLNS